MTNVLDFYEKRVPDPYNALDLFSHQWTTVIPGTEFGRVPLMTDDRVKRFLQSYGSVEGKSVLELGPLEGGHTKMLCEAGAEVLAIESNSQAYLRCLVIKEIFGYRARFLLGDFVPLLAETDLHFDIVFASGVLYHMTDPISVLRNILRVGDSVLMWTHYYDATSVAKNPVALSHLSGEREKRNGLRLWRYDYNTALNNKGFCGGPMEHSLWMEKHDIFAIIEACGFRIDYAEDDPDHQNGPSILLFLSKRS